MYGDIFTRTEAQKQSALARLQAKAARKAAEAEAAKKAEAMPGRAMLPGQWSSNWDDDCMAAVNDSMLHIRVGTPQEIAAHRADVRAALDREQADYDWAHRWWITRIWHRIIGKDKP